MSNQTNSNSSALIRENREGPVSLLSQPTDLCQFLMSRGLFRPIAGSFPLKWGVVTAGNGSATLFDENDAAPASGRRTFAEASISPFYAQAVASITGRLRDQIANGGLTEDILRGELTQAFAALMYLVESTLLGSAQDKGIASIVDSGDTYAGIAPGSVAAWASLEIGSVGTLDASDMNTCYRRVHDQPYNGKTSAILTAPSVIQSYGDIAGIAATTSLTRLTAPAQSGQAYDIGMLPALATFNGIPFIPIRNHTASEAEWLDLNMVESGRPGVEITVVRDVNVRPLAVTGDNDEYLVTAGFIPVFRNRRRHARQTGIS
jgi:hypothetical protein